MPHDIDILAAGHGNYDTNHFQSSVQFCPKCGVKSLSRHTRELSLQRKPIEAKEYWCATCGFSFNIRMSEDWKLAMRYARDHRQMRTLPRFQERYLAPEVAENWKAQAPDF